MAQHTADRSMAGWLIAAAVVMAGAVATGYNLVPGLSTLFTGPTAEAHGQTKSPAPVAPVVAEADPAAQSTESDDQAADQAVQEAQDVAAQAAAAADQATADAIGKVGQLYAAMPPAKAAAILKNMDDSAVVAILRAVDQDQAGMILALMDPARSAQITAELMKPVPPVMTTTP